MTTNESLSMFDTSVTESSGALSKIKPQPSYPANPTLYLSNIDWSIKKPLLKRSLLSLFTRHGKVLEVVVLRGDVSSGGNTRSLRGQAWVIFESLTAATAALQAEQGFVFFGRPLMVNYAKEVSDRVAKRDGSYQRSKGRGGKRKLDDLVVDGEDDPTSLETAATGNLKPCDGPTTRLLAQNVPEECNEMMLGMLFNQYPGLLHIALVKAGMFSIEFEGEKDAIVAKNGLNGFKLTATSTLNLTFVE